MAIVSLMQHKKFFLLLCVQIFLFGCQTTEGFIISESKISLRQSRIAIVSALGPARVISPNGREIVSHYHDRARKYLEVTPKINERLYTKVLILGARRPYNINIEVRVERRDPDSLQFIDVGLDESLTVSQAKLVHDALNQSRDRAQTIDDGVPF